ncbi:MAG: hypothetical protein ACRELG_29780 [Gemmataceae bacterium]
MSNPSQNKVTVRVEVVVEGGGASTVMMSPPARQLSHYDFISIPQPAPTSTPIVSQSAGVNYIEATGTSPLSSDGSPPNKVWALAYPNPNVTTTGHKTPDFAGGAVSMKPDPDTWYWHFLQSDDNNVVPGAFCAGSPCPPDGDDNSTLLVWWEYDTPSGPTYTPGVRHFYGYCPGSSSGSGAATMPATVAFGSRRLATTLHATFTRALAKLGTVTLAWNGVSWAGDSSVGGGCVLSLLSRDETLQLMSAGPGATFILAAPSGPGQPFSWTAEGSAHGALSGGFGVIIVE